MEIKNSFMKTEVGVIPVDWKVAYIPELILKKDGIKIGPFGSQLKKELLVQDGFKVYGQENVFEKNMDIGEKYINIDHFDRLKTCELKSGDFIISMMGTIGKTMIVPGDIQKGIMDSHLLRLRLNEESIHPNLLQHFFTSNILKDQVSKLSVGGIMDGLSSKIIKNIAIPLPPTKSEQTAIATALSDADALITSLEKLIEKKRAIKQGAMQELLKPKKGWVEKLIKDVSEVKRGAGSQYTKYTQHNGVRFIRINDFFENSPVYVEPTEDMMRFVLSENDILFAGTGNTAGACFLPKKEWIGFPHSYNAPRIRVKNSIDKLFLLYTLKSENILNQQRALFVGAAQPFLDITAISSFIFPLPKEKSEQEGIAQILSDMDTEILYLAQKLSKYKLIKQGMMQELLTGKIRLV